MEQDFFYGSVTEVANLMDGAIEASAISDAVKRFVNSCIDNAINHKGFNQHSITEYITIKKSFQSVIILDNCPIIEITALYNDNNVTPVLFAATDYIVDLEAGIIELNNAISAYETDYTTIFNSYFAVGLNAVKVEYTYGYATVPDDIQNFANAIMAQLLKNPGMIGTTASNLKSVKIGDYSESYDLGISAMGNVFDTMLSMQLKTLKRKYAISV